MKVVVFGASCVGKSEQCKVLRARLSDWFVFETDEIKEVRDHLHGEKVVKYADRFSEWHRDIKKMRCRKDYDHILEVALKIMDVAQPVLCFASNPSVVKGMQASVNKSIFLTASEDALLKRADDRRKPDEIEDILRRNRELKELATSVRGSIIDTSSMSVNEVSQRLIELIDDSRA